MRVVSDIFNWPSRYRSRRRWMNGRHCSRRWINLIVVDYFRDQGRKYVDDDFTKHVCISLSGRECRKDQEQLPDVAKSSQTCKGKEKEAHNDKYLFTWKLCWHHRSNSVLFSFVVQALWIVSSRYFGVGRRHLLPRRRAPSRVQLLVMSLHPNVQATASYHTQTVT